MNRCHFWNRKSISSVSERRRSPQPFSSLPIEYLCVCSEQHLMLQSRMTGFQNQGPHHWFPGYVLKTPLPCTISRTTLLVFNVTCHSHWTCPLITTHTHCSSQTSRIGFKDSSVPGVLVQHRQLPKGMLILSPADTMQKTDQTRGCYLLETPCCSRRMVKLHSVNRTFIRSHLLSLLLVS